MESEKLTGWQPIETAPLGDAESGPFFDVCWQGETHRYLPVLHRETECYNDGCGIKREHGYPSMTKVFLRKPTHWIYPPAPPGTTRAPADCKLADNDGKNCVLLEDHEGSCLSYDPKEVGVRLMSALGHVENCRTHGRVTDAGFAAIRSALLIADRELSRLRAPADLRSALEAETIERAARAMCVHDGLDPDEHIIGGQASGFEDYGPLWQAEQRSEGQLGITDYAGLARAALAPTKGDVS